MFCWRDIANLSTCLQRLWGLESNLKMIAGNFLDELPKDKQYLYKYFVSEIQHAYIKYCHIFGNEVRVKEFMSHTGYVITYRYLVYLRKMYGKIEQAHKEAKNNFDFNMINKIENGEFDVKYE